MDINMQRLEITSPAFEEGGWIPARYTCEGEGIHPELKIRHIPSEARSLLLLLEDPDAPGSTFDHWLAWDIDTGGNIAANSLPGTSGTNSSGHTGYYPPCPPEGAHRYIFVIFALDKELRLKTGSSKKQVMAAIDGSVIARGTLTGRYESSGKKA